MQLGEITEPKIEQLGPPPNGEFVYIDISSVDNASKRIAEPRRLRAEEAPSRARQRIKSGDVLVSMTRPNLNAVALVPSELSGAVASTGFHVLRARAGVLPEWLYYGVQARRFVSAMSELVQGALYPAVRPKDIRSFDIPVPPLNEQRRIVAEIGKQFSRLDDAIAALHRVKAGLEQYRTVVLRSAVAGRLVGASSATVGDLLTTQQSGSELLEAILRARRLQWSARGRCPEPIPPDASDLWPLPNGWVWASADQLSDFITKGSTPAPSHLAERKGEIQFLKVYNLTFYGVLNRLHKPVFVNRRTHESELARSKVRPGDVLINIVGPPLGQVSVVPDDLPEANINQAVARVRPIAPLPSKFVALCLMADVVMGWAIRRAKTTAGQSNLTLELCRALPIPLPPLAEQERIVAEVDRRLSIAAEVEADIDANLKRAAILRQSILTKAFSPSIDAQRRTLKASHEMEAAA